MAICFLFPGQSSRRTGMLEAARALDPASDDVLRRATEVLGRAPSDDFESPTNHDVQVGVFVASMMHLAALEARGVVAERSLGLSLGEYAHLVHIGALDFADALRLVDTRGALYDEGPDGKMVAIFPLPKSELADVLAAHGEGRVVIANENSPTQHVIGGPRIDVDRVVAALDRDHHVEAITIDDRVAMHTPCFEPVARRFRGTLERAPFAAPRAAYRPNVGDGPLSAPSRADLVDHLARHVCEPVRWREAIETCVAEAPEVTFVEVGPGRVLSNLLQRRWVKNRRLSTDGGVNAALEVLRG